MKLYIYSCLLLLTAALAGCKKEDEKVAAENGIIFSPLTPYQESYPGNIISFSFKLRIPETVTSYGLRFKLPGATEYISLPEYPDQTSAAQIAAAAKFQTFEYALPGSAVAVNSIMMFKFIAVTAAKTYEKEYTVKMLSVGLQRARLYNAAAANIFRFSTIDLLRTVAVPQALAPAASQDIVPVYTRVGNPVTGTSLDAIIGWTSNNGTLFKPITAANYAAAVSTYPAIYAGIAASAELSQVNTLNSPTLLAANAYYMAKVNRNGVFTYAAILVKKSPNVTALNVGSTVSVDLLQEYIELELKK